MADINVHKTKRVTIKTSDLTSCKMVLITIFTEEGRDLEITLFSEGEGIEIPIITNPADD